MTARVAIVGDGVSGLTLASLLQRAGLSFRVFRPATNARPQLATGLWNRAQEIVLGSIAREFVGDSAYRSQSGHLLATPPRLSQTPSGGPSLAFAMSDEILMRLSSELPASVFEDARGNDVDSLRKEFDLVVVASGMAANNSLAPCGYDVYRGLAPRPDKYRPFQTWATRSGSRFASVPVPGDRVQWFATLRSEHSSPILTAEAPLEMWTRRATDKEVANLSQHMSSFHSPVSTLVASSAEHSGIMFCHAFASVAIPSDSPSSKDVIRIGDAFHTMDPILAIGASLAVEEAEMLSRVILGSLSLSDFSTKRLKRRQKVMQISGLANVVSQLGHYSNSAASLRNAAMGIVPEFVKTAVIRSQIELLADRRF